MITEFSSPIAPLSASRRKQLSSALTQVLTPAQLVAARELILSEAPGRLSPGPEEILYWMRVNMPLATRRVEKILFPRD
ncbi:MAG: hypothetical protein ACHQ2Z_08815 [Elusimicrobiota bacterium]